MFDILFDVRLQDHQNHPQDHQNHSRDYQDHPKGGPGNPVCGSGGPGGGPGGGSGGPGGGSGGPEHRTEEVFLEIPEVVLEVFLVPQHTTSSSVVAKLS